MRVVRGTFEGVVSGGGSGLGVIVGLVVLALVLPGLAGVGDGISTGMASFTAWVSHLWSVVWRSALVAVGVVIVVCSIPVVRSQRRPIYASEAERKQIHATERIIGTTRSAAALEPPTVEVISVERTREVVQR